MHAIDFEYDKRYLSDFGFIICDFNSSSSANIVDAGGKITFNTVSNNNGKKRNLISTQYDECVESTFHVCKNPDKYDMEDMEITDDEYRRLFRWLNRREFLEIRFIDDSIDAIPRYYYGGFNVSKILIAEKLYGLELTMITDKPYAYGEEEKYYWEFDDVSKYSLLYDFSEDIGFFSPNIKITCLESGDLSINNELADSTMIINNCTLGEVITINGDAQIVASSLNSHDIWNDFNYEFLKIGNMFNNRNNKLTTTLRCILEITYRPIIKDSP